MRRTVLISLTVVSSVIVALAGAGLFATLSDTASSGTNRVETGALPPSADLQVAVWTPTVCGSFDENLASPLVDVTIENISDVPWNTFCLKNVGAASVWLSAGADELVDSEVGCTGDEAAYDATCGSGSGELSSALRLMYGTFACTGGDIAGAGERYLSDDVDNPIDLGSLAPGQTRCFSISILPTFASEAQKQAVQSDRATWRFVWHAQAA